MKIIITGGTGLIGSALAADLAKDGHEVVILSRDAARAQARGLPKGVRALNWDGKSASGWGKEADGAYGIVNLAGESIAGENLLKLRWTPARKEGILNSRLNAGKAVMEAIQAATNKPRVLIQASAVGFYGPCDEKPFDEGAPNGSDFQSAVCRQWEDVTRPLDTLGVRRAIIRSGVVLSTRGGALPLQSLPFKLFAGGPIGSGKQGYPWIHIMDEIKAIRFLLDTPTAHGVFNLTAPQAIDNAQFGHALGKALSRPSFFPTPAFVFKIAFGEAATILVDGQKPQPKRLLELGYKFQFADAESALRDLFKKGI